MSERFLVSDGDFDVALTQQRVRELNKHIFLLELTSSRPVYGSGGRFRLLANGSLLIRQVGEDDEGLYLCEAENGVSDPLGKLVGLKINGKTSYREGQLFAVILKKQW